MVGRSCSSTSVNVENSAKTSGAYAQHQKQYVSYDYLARANRTPWTKKIVHNARMYQRPLLETAYLRLRQARREAGFKTASAAVKAFPKELNLNTLISNENGNRPISKKMALVYSKVFGIDAGWLIYGTKAEAEEIADRDVPLLSMVSASNLRFQPGVEEHDIIRRIKVGDLPKGDWIALQVDGDSMNRIAPDGAIIVVDRSDDRLIDGKFYIFSVDNGDATFKMFKRNPDRLQPYSTNPDHMAVPADRDDLYVFGRVKRVIMDV